MSETSYPWDGTTVGDASSAPYDAPSEFAEWMKCVAGALAIETNVSGMFRQQPLNSLNAISGGAGNYTFDSGTALVYGTVYVNGGPSAAINIPTPSVATRIDRVVLRKDWVLQTIRLTRIAGVEGGAAPYLVQTGGTTWDMPLWQFSITTGGVITATDERQILQATQTAAIAFDDNSAPSPASPYVLLFVTTLFETAASMHDTGVLKGRLAIPIPGVYRIDLNIGQISATLLTDLQVQIRKNGVALRTFFIPVVLGKSTSVAVFYYDRFAFGDYVDFNLIYVPAGAATITIVEAQASITLIGTP